MYNECVQFTRQFAFCPNAFRVDLYKGCDFGCKYCFANMNWSKYHNTSMWDLGDIDKVKRLFHVALETDEDSKNVLVELMRHRVPMHCGGMSDPFQTREWEYGLTYKLIELSKQFDYPIQFSTKTSKLPSKYFNVLDPKIHAFQVSIIGWDESYTRMWEHNTASAQERLNFVKMLRDKGFWCGVRIQPIIDIDQCIKLCHNLQDIPSYVTLEHYKSIYSVKDSVNAFLALCPNKQDYIITNAKISAKKNVKIDNICKLKSILNTNGVKVGVGDNDLHYMSDTRCCCGLDTIGEAFNGYLKYNLTYMSTGEFPEDVFIPKCNPRRHINDPKCGHVIDCKQYAEDYIKNHPTYLGSKQSEIEKKLFGISKHKLF